MSSATALHRFWSARAPREQRVLAAGAAILLLAVFYALCIAPAAEGIARLQRQLPQLRQQSARLEALLSEARALKGVAPAAVPGGADARAQVERTLAEAGLTVAQKEALPGGDLRVTFANAPFAKWTAWLVSAERKLGVHATAVRVRSTAGDAPGNADIELTLRLPRP